jgi:hypothetical protein
VAAWLADLSWPAVVGVMALALAIAWLVEWVSWRDAQARATAPRLEYRHLVEEAQVQPEPEPEPLPVVETVPDPVAVEPDPEPVPVPAEAARAPEPVAPEPMEGLPELESAESRSEAQPDEVPEPDAQVAPTPKGRRVWRRMSFRRVDSAEAAPSWEPPAPAESSPIGAEEPPQAPANEPQPPVKVEVRPEPEPRRAYAPPRVVPTPPPAEATPVVPRVPTNVVRMPQSTQPREWNVWELETLARERARLEPERGEEWSYLFVHLRQFADARGKLPSEFDGLVRESFGELLETLEPA